MVGPSVAAAPPAAMVPATRAGDGRVRRNITAVAALWLAYGILRAMELSWAVIFGRMFFSPWGWGGNGWPFNGWSGFEPLVWRGLLFGGISLGAFAVVYLILAWSLFQREPWARVLGIVMGCLALLRFPFGTALGIYTLWVLLPETSRREYDAMAGVGSRANPAR
ncbi:MAG: hypothetical protein WBD19_02545 [Candidatus Acidiferrum sp.]